MQSFTDNTPFGTIADAADAGPVLVTRENGKAVVVLRADAYAELLDKIQSIGTLDLDDDMLKEFSDPGEANG